MYDIMRENKRNEKETRYVECSIAVDVFKYLNGVLVALMIYMVLCLVVFTILILMC